MIVGTGVDITEAARIRATLGRFGDRFLRRFFTPEEVRYGTSEANPAERLGCNRIHLSLTHTASQAMA